MGKQSNQRKNDLATNRLLALERAVRELMVVFDDNNIHGLVNCVMRGWIVDGRFTDEYRRLTEQALDTMRAEQAAAREAAEAEARAREVREAILQTSMSTNAQQPTTIVDTARL